MDERGKVGHGDEEMDEDEGDGISCCENEISLYFILSDASATPLYYTVEMCNAHSGWKTTTRASPH